MNRSTLRTEVLDYMDATGSGRWDTTPGGILDRRISSVYDRIWREMLNVNPEYRIGLRTPTSDANGRYLLADLSVGVDDTLQRFYRVRGVVIDLYPYDGPVQFSEWAPLTIQSPGTAQRVWYQEGTSLVALPIQAQKQADAIWVNYIPQRPDQLESDNSTVEWPDGYDDVLIGYSAARLLTKSGAETGAAQDILKELLPDYRAMMGDISRVATKPQAIQYLESSADWGV